ncbi:MAG TPA: lysoplasmalogenase [Burkholderiaceae bacterium]|nr:lysoplasmalogenase [Burkholderiaceae bacterium]
MPPHVMPIAAVAAALLAVAGNLLALPVLVYVFKPATTLLIIAWAWPRGAEAPAVRRWIRAGLWLSLAGDVFLMWPQGFLPGLVSFLLAHLAYIAAFTRTLRFAARWQPFAVYAVIAAGLLSILWPGVPAALQLPVVAYVVCLASMAAQAGTVWLAARGTASEALARQAAIGGLLFMSSDALLAFNKFHAPLPLASLWILATYWIAQAMIARSLRGRSG